MKFLLKKFKFVILFLFTILIWAGVVKLFSIPAYLIPSPFSVLTAIIENFKGLFLDTFVTGTESLVGFIIATIVSIFSAVLFSSNKLASSFIMPFLIGLKAIPIIAIAPLLVLWFGNEFLSKALMAAIISFFPIVVNLVRGLRDVPHEEIELLESMAASNYQIFKYLRVPNSLPYLLSGLKIASTLSVVGAIVGETVGANRGIGHLIIVASLRIETELVFCGIIFASLLGVAFYYSIEFFEKKLVFWRDTDVE